MSSADIIQSLWIGGKLSTLERLSIASFLAHGHEYHLYTYGDVEGVPSGVVLKDGAEILAVDAVFKNDGADVGSKSFAGFSDWFRYELLNKRGGWWCDSDLVCVRPFTFSRGAVVATSYEREWGRPALGCALKLPPGDSLLDYCLQVCRNSNISEMVAKSYGAIGPHLLQAGIRDLGLTDYMVDPAVFCPIGWRQTVCFVQSTPGRWIHNLKAGLTGGEMLRPESRKSHAIHMWNAAWDLYKIDKDGRYPKSSIYEKLKQRYLAEALA